MRVLVVNAGSSSLKSQLIETDGKVTLMKCLAEKVGTPGAFMNVSFAPDFQKTTYNVADMPVQECLAKLLDILVDDPESPISSLSQIDAIGNRVVAGGEYFTRSVIIDEAVREKLAICEELAPLHNPPADACIDLMREAMAQHPAGRGLRHRFPCDHASESLHVTPCRVNTTRSTAFAAMARTERAIVMPHSKPRTCLDDPCATWALSLAIWATAARSQQ